MPGEIRHATDHEPRAVPLPTGGRLARKYEYLVFFFFAVSSWCLEITTACLGSLYGAQSHLFIATIVPFLVTHWAAFLQTFWMMATAPRRTIADRMAYLNLACRFQRLCAPTALIGMVTWAVAYRFRGKASSQAYWIIFLVVWILNTVVCLMNVYNNVSWESDLLLQIAPEYQQGNFWLGVFGIRSICRHDFESEPRYQKSLDEEDDEENKSVMLGGGEEEGWELTEQGSRTRSTSAAVLLED